MERLIREIKECRRCQLSQTATNKVIGRGSFTPTILFIGEAPGKEEDKKGVPFVGRSGKLLNEWIEHLELSPDDYAIINCVKCRPPKNRDPKPEEIEACKEYLYKQIKLLKPKVIILLGRISLKTILNRDGITKIAGEKMYAEEPEFLKQIPIYALPHPAYFLRRGIYESYEILDKIKDDIKETMNTLIIPSLHNHTVYSTGDGFSQIEEMVQYISGKIDALAITDHGTISGWYKFGKVCKKYNVKPIYGIEFYVEYNKKSYHLIALAKNETGIRNILKLNSIANQNFYKRPRVPLKYIFKYNKGLIITTACLGGLIPSLILNNEMKEAVELIKNFKKYFKSGFYFELQPHDLKAQRKVNSYLISFSKKFNIPLILTYDTHYLKYEELKCHKALKAIAYKKSYEEAGFQTVNYYLTNKELKRALEKANIPQSLYKEIKENIEEIVEKCNATFPIGQNMIPEALVDKKLEDLCWEKLKELDLEKPEYIQRLKKELEIIKKKELEDYFLIVYDIINYARKNNILIGAGRGSAVGSLVVYLLGITSIDPLQHNLLFERFLDPERFDNPDIDIDFQRTRRDEIYDYITRKYGEEKVCRIVTFGHFHLKQALRDLSRIFEIPLHEVDNVSKSLEGIDDYEEALEVPEFRLFLTRYPQIGKFLPRFIGKIRHRSLHAAGVVITPVPLDEIISYEKVRGKFVSPFPKDDLDEMGILKLDILSLKTLDIIANTLKLIGKDYSYLPTEFDQPEVYRVFQEGKTLGVFQFKSNLLTQISKRMQISNFKELYDATTIARPGPLHSGQTEKYIRRVRGEEKVTYLHESLKEITEDTYGLLLYQEQIMLAAVKLANFTYTEANQLRKIISKSKGIEMMDTYRDRFIEGCISNGISSESAERIWSAIREAGKYSFNRSHAVAYSAISYWCAYLRAKHPKEWLISVAIMDEDYRRKALYELQECGVKINPPDINKSGADYSIVNGEVYTGLLDIDGVGEKAVEEILKHQPYRSLEDFCYKVNRRKVNKGILKRLVLVGAFDSFGERKKIYSMLFGEELSDKELLKYQREYLKGIDYSQITCKNCNFEISPIKEVDFFTEGEYWLSGTIENLESRKISDSRVIFKSADFDARFILRDNTWEINCYLAPELYKIYKSKMENGVNVILRGRVVPNIDKLMVDFIYFVNQENCKYSELYINNTADNLIGEFETLSGRRAVIDRVSYHVSKKGNPYARVKLNNGDEGLIFNFPNIILHPGMAINYVITEPPFIKLLRVI